MIVPYLPEDCIYNILKYLQNYRSTLFNCLLVNRFWCKATVPLLYADPFDYTLNEKIIITIISCFNKAEKSQLKLDNINININIRNERKPLFEYLRYLKNFDYNKINFTLFHWLNLSPYKDRNRRFPIFYQSILRQCINIQQLSISLHLFDSKNYKNFNNYYNYKNWNIQTLTSNLTKLISLRLHLRGDRNNEISQEFLSNISNICLNLKKLEIDTSYTSIVNTDCKKNIRTIIQKQNNLKVFKLLSTPHRFNDILLSLEFQRHPLLTYVEFCKIDFSYASFDNFINLRNLKCLRFEKCKRLSLDQCEVLKYASFKLEGLYFVHNIWNDNCITILPSMIKYLSESLKELILTDLNILIIESISMYCPNLITLEIKIMLDTSIIAFPYFKNLKIRNLNIIDGCDYTQIFKNLANNLTTNVKEVSMYHYNGLSHFEEFLENCHNCLETINLSHPIELEFLRIVLNYVERSNNNCLKFLGVMELEKVLDDEESKLLDQIKAKGVKIVDFYSIYKYTDFSF